MCTNFELMGVYMGEPDGVTHPVHGHPIILGPFTCDILHGVLQPGRDDSVLRTLHQRLGPTKLQMAIAILGDMHFRLAVLDKGTLHVMDPLHLPAEYPPQVKHTLAL